MSEPLASALLTNAMLYFNILSLQRPLATS